jgi:DNA invertase Pin-like site-specific DNA recombinase
VRASSLVLTILQLLRLNGYPLSKSYPIRRMTSVYSYERVSLPQQALGRGLGRQSDAALAWASSRGLSLDSRLQLSDAGRSASKGEHLTKGALGRFLQLAQAGQLGDAPILLVEAIDRLSRQEPLDAIETILTGLVGSGVRIVTLEDGAEYSRETLRSDPTKLLVLVVKMQAAYEYSARLGMRMRDSWSGVRDKIRNGIVSRPRQFCPFWCDWSPEHGYRHNAHATTVRQALEMLQDRGSYAAARDLNQQGLLMANGKPWTHSIIRRLAANPAVYGAVQLHTRAGKPTEVHEGILPPLVTKEFCDQLRSAMSRRAYGKPTGRTGTTNWIGQAMTTCVCGTRVGMTVSGPKRYRQSYLRCRERESNGTGCKMRGVKLENATAHLLTRFEPEQLQGLIAACSQEDGTHAKRLAVCRAEQQHNELLQQQANAAKAFTAAARAGVDLTTVLTLQADLEREVQAAGQQLDDARQALAQLEAMRSGEALEPVLRLQRAFAMGQDTAEQRQACNRTLLAMGLRIVLDGDRQQMGLAIGDGPLQWQPIRVLDRSALYWGDRLEEQGGMVVAAREADFAAELRRSNEGENL